MYGALFSAALLAGAVRAQQVGTSTAEVHPKLTVQKCTTSGGCTSSTQSIVIDANWRWVHNVGGYTNCYSGNTWDSTLCPDAVTCAANCAVDGADYSGTYGITTSGSSLKMNFVTKGSSTNIGSRVYLLDSSDAKYQMFQLLNQEFTFDVDVSNLPCGLNGALYFSEMSADGGLAAYSGNKAGAKYGTGYCDAQCPQDLKFINGKANSAGWAPSSGDPNSGTGVTGSCCTEMDIWEANSQATAYTPHPCSVSGQTACTGDDCGNGSDNRYSSVCDKDGCDFNSYRWGNQTFYGPGLTIDSKQKVSVVTQFITSTGTASGSLKAINRLYVQNGKVFQNSYTNVAGIDAVNDITDAFCTQQKSVTGNTNAFAQKGGLGGMATAFSKGMVLVMSLWDDHAANALWLDSTYPVDGTGVGVQRGPCATDSGVPATIEQTEGSSSVTYSNIRWGDIGSTYTGTTVGGGSPPPSSSSSSKPGSSSTKPPSSTTKPTSAPTTKPTTTTTTTTTTSKAPSSSGVAHYGQCGGTGYTGSTTCASPYTCKYSNPYYSQCL